MSVEHAPHQPESTEHLHELEAMAERQRAERETSPETFGDLAERQANDVETARKIIDRQDDRPEPTATAETAAPKPTFSARLTQALSYRETMASLQHKLTPVQRQFSQVIHMPIVEKTSEALEMTVMRPSVALGGVTTALIVGGIFYYFAHHYGYAMRGSELIISLIVGGVIGLAIEGLSRSLRRLKR